LFGLALDIQRKFAINPHLSLNPRQKKPLVFPLLLLKAPLLFMSYVQRHGFTVVEPEDSSNGKSWEDHPSQTLTMNIIMGNA
jgi:hypothetical protein